MVVVTLTDCPPKLRGDLTKWLMEINTGVYVGKVSARIREMLWTRICENLSQGRAIMNREWNSVCTTHPGNLWILMEYNWLCGQSRDDVKQKRVQVGQKYNRCCLRKSNLKHIKNDMKVMW